MNKQQYQLFYFKKCLSQSIILSVDIEIKQDYESQNFLFLGQYIFQSNYCISLPKIKYSQIIIIIQSEIIRMTHYYFLKCFQCAINSI
ncbi:hypothetical protein pb186bvf_004507 [Paramecium bursaria]